MAIIISNVINGKKIEIPEIEVTVTSDYSSVTIKAIDKEKYKDFLDLKPVCINYKKDNVPTNYTGDEITLKDIPGSFSGRTLGISLSSLVNFNPTP